jgi:acetyl esterase/lipase
MAKKQKKHKKVPFYRRKWLLWTICILLALLVIGFLAFRLSPWPGALIIRTVFNHGGAQVKQALEKHAPGGITKLSDQQYAPSDKHALLDVYYPEGIAESGAVQPTVIWTHGGAWISGDKADAEPYFRLLSSKGYTVISVNYTLAPEKSYPVQIEQLNQAHSYIVDNAARFHVDASQLFLAGDSAGSQLSAQLAAMITNPVYADEVGIVPSLNPASLKGVLLNCGIYQMDGLVHPDATLPKIVGWGNDVAVWSFAGTRDFNDPVIRQMSPYYHVTQDFPPAYITGGNADPLTDAQSKPFAEKLTSLGVEVQTLFYPADHQPALPHEYQFNLDNADGQKAFDASVEFLSKHTE